MRNKQRCNFKRSGYRTNHDRITSISMLKCGVHFVILAFLLNFEKCYVQAADYHSNKTLNTKFASEVVLETSPYPTVIHDSLGKFANSSLNKTILSNESSSLRGIQVNAVYISERNKIVLNVSWDKPSNLDHLQFYLFKVTPYSTYSKCIDKSFETTIENKFATQIFLPPHLNSYEIHPECTYKISLIADYSMSRRITKELNYTVQECVGKKCSCRRLAAQCVDLRASETSPGKLNVSWIFCEPGNEKIYNITHVMLEYRPDTPEGDHSLFHKIPLFANFQPKENYVLLNEAHEHFRPEKPYQLQATFTNIYNCRTSNLTHFTVSSPMLAELLNDTSPSEIDWLVLILAFILMSFLILTVTYLVRRNRLIIKEIILNPFSLRFSRRDSHRSELRNSYLMVPTVTKRQQELNVLYVDKEIIDGTVDRYEFPRSRIYHVREIGSGAFGQVYLAKAYGIENGPGYTYVAVKALREKAPPEELDDFLSEIEILKKVGEHPNIVSMYGCCILQEPYLLIMEFVPCGNLKDYLLDLREKWRKKRIRNGSTTSDGAYVAPVPGSPVRKTISERPSISETEYTSFESDGSPTPTDVFTNKVESTLDHTELQNFALQIARGMSHLEKIPIAHRDLAARNILINEYKTLKISDFGLSRFGPYVNNKTKKMPLRWVAIEAIEDHFYDSKGDVWSFAVVLWEIGTLGAFPYDNIPDGMLHNYLANGRRLSRPEICTDELYSLMLKCWSHDPQLRPSFKELVDILDVKRRRVYVDFNQLNPLYVFPPSQLEELCTNRLNVQEQPST